MSEKIVIQINKRPWYEWLLWAIWAVLLVSILQMAISSGPELEPRAGSIFWVSFFVVLIGGGVTWFMRRSK
jgi:hypothetical protein